MYQACIGIWRGISFVRVGVSLSGALKPKKAPTKTNGTEMPNHISSNTSIVVKGMAPDEPCDQMKRLRMKKIDAMMPGYRNAVSSVAVFPSVPRNDLYVWDA